jgi:hypothetical protein
MQRLRAIIFKMLSWPANAGHPGGVALQAKTKQEFPETRNTIPDFNWVARIRGP